MIYTTFLDPGYLHDQERYGISIALFDGSYGLMYGMNRMETDPSLQSLIAGIDLTMNCQLIVLLTE
jgi:hypothetical protein